MPTHPSCHAVVHQSPVRFQQYFFILFPTPYTIKLNIPSAFLIICSTCTLNACVSCVMSLGSLKQFKQHCLSSLSTKVDNCFIVFYLPSLCQFTSYVSILLQAHYDFFHNLTQIESYPYMTYVLCLLFCLTSLIFQFFSPGSHIKILLRCIVIIQSFIG